MNIYFFSNNLIYFIYIFTIGKFRREFRNALEKCRCGRARIEDRSLYHSTPASRMHISPSSRSNYTTTLRDITLRERQTFVTSFVENGANGLNGNGNSGNGSGNGHNINHHTTFGLQPSHTQSMMPNENRSSGIMSKPWRERLRVSWVRTRHPLDQPRSAAGFETNRLG